jgi:hypothetical protein
MKSVSASSTAALISITHTLRRLEMSNVGMYDVRCSWFVDQTTQSFGHWVRILEFWNFGDRRLKHQSPRNFFEFEAP